MLINKQSFLLRNKVHLISILTAIFISTMVLFPSFNLALLGDDWLAFFRYNQHLGPRSPGQWNHFTYFLTPYGAQDIAMGLMQKIYDYNSSLYYETSFVLRIFAATSIYLLVYFLTKSKLAAFYSMLFFSITPTGFDTTNWSSNMTTYITIALFSLFLYFFLKTREGKNDLFLIPSLAIYYIAYVTTPIRMHGSIPFIFLLEVFWILQKRNLPTVKKAGIRFFLVLVIFLIIRFTGQSLGPPNEATERLGIGITTDLTLLEQGRSDFLFYPIVMFGGMFIPDFILPFNQSVGNLTQLSLKLILPSLLGFLLLTFFITKNTAILLNRFFKLIVFAQLIWSTLVAITYKLNLITFSDPRLIFLSLIGGYIFILGGFLIFHFLKQSKISTAYFLALSWSILSFFFAWWWVPQSIFPSTYRYLTISTIGISIIPAIIISLGKESKNRLILFSFFLTLTIIHAVATRVYINQLLISHNQQISQKIWSAIPHISELGKTREPIVFYFEGDGSNGDVLHDVITFGFPPHMGLIYNLREDEGIPVPVSDPKELISMVRDGKPLPAYGYPIKPVPINHIYAFHLQGRDNLINITDLARSKLQNPN